MIRGKMKRGTIAVFKAVCRAQFLTFEETAESIVMTGRDLKITITRNKEDGNTYDIVSESSRRNLKRDKKSMCDASQIQGRVMDLIHAYKADSMQRRRRTIG